jgi:hypothetical protein
LVVLVEGEDEDVSTKERKEEETKKKENWVNKKEELVNLWGGVE